MEIKFFQHGIKLTDKTRDYLEEKVTKLEKYLKDGETLAEVEVEKDKKGNFRVEIQIHKPGERYIGDEISETIEAAADVVVDELSRQIRQEKKKKQTIRKRGEISLKKKFSIDENARF